MKIAFVSNFYNHHQKPFSDAMYELLSGEYTFIQMSEMSSERKEMGWGLTCPPYVVDYYSNKEMANAIINTADVVICSNGYECLMRQRYLNSKLVFIYGERIYKSGVDFLRLIKHAFVNYSRFGHYRNCYCLCSSAFASYDWSRSLSFRNKCLKWGYFPAFIKYMDLSPLMQKKSNNQISILFVSRQIELKHPELPVAVLKKLHDEGIKAHLTMIGDGPLLYKTVQNVCAQGLKDHVEIVKSVTPEEVRSYMEKANIFLFTSDKNEGWGAVLNEAMNSACAVVASSEIGSVPFLIDDGKNGFIYEGGNFDDIYMKTKALATNQELREKMGIAAYSSIEKEWNAEIATKRFIGICENLLKKMPLSVYETGPCSQAEIIKDGWYKKR